MFSKSYFLENKKITLLHSYIRGAKVGFSDGICLYLPISCRKSSTAIICVSNLKKYKRILYFKKL